jgi:hypothetical protein
MSAVSKIFIQTIKELQSLPSLSQFALAGGTNLAFRFNHRESQDIDLFCPEIVGVKHLEAIENEIKTVARKCLKKTKITRYYLFKYLIISILSCKFSV